MEVEVVECPLPIVVRSMQPSAPLSLPLTILVCSSALVLCVRFGYRFYVLGLCVRLGFMLGFMC